VGITAFPFTAVIDVPTARILGRDDAGTGAAEALTNTEIFAILGTGAPSASTYLRGDGTWSAVSAGVGGSTGSVDNAVLRADGAGGATLQASSIVITDNFTASPNATVNHASIQATGDTTNVSVSVVPKGTGSFSLQVPDGTVTGGDARGANAVDLQGFRFAANQVASGQYAVAIGAAIRVAGSYGVGLGYGHVIGGTAGGAVGSSNRVDNAGFATGVYAYSLGTERVHAADSFSAQGGQQIVDAILRSRTTGTTAGNMLFRVRSGFLQTYLAQISGANSAGAVAVYFRKIIIKNIAGTLTLVNSEVIGTDYEDNASTDLVVDTSGTNLRFRVTGIAGETWTWCTVLYGMDNQW
jgi:hypothetical protein